MARTARIKDAFGTYYVTQNSSGCRPLFKGNDDRDKFIDILSRTVNKFNCKIIEYCVQDNNTYHLIIDVNGGDLSKIMKSINIPYGMHASCDGKLFKDRYKSSPIKDDIELLGIRNAISASMNLDDGYNSFCGTSILPCSDLPASTCIECILTTEDAYNHIAKKALNSNLSLQDFFKDKALRNSAIKEIRRSSTLSLKLIGELFGGISESTVCKILNQPD